MAVSFLSLLAKLEFQFLERSNEKKMIKMESTRT